MTLKAQASPTQTWSDRGRTQLLAVFIVSLALLVALVGLAVVSRPAVVTHAAVTPTIIDRGADQSSATKVVLDRGADQSSATLNSTIYGPRVNASTGFDLNAASPSILDRGADR